MPVLFMIMIPTIFTSAMHQKKLRKMVLLIQLRMRCGLQMLQPPLNIDSLTTIPVVLNNVGFEGEGEVLDIIYSPQPGKINLEIDSTEQLIAEQSYVQLPSGYVIRKFAEDTTRGKGHKLILT